ncbi:MAG: hypothetical protein MI919_00275 [Holophagales bacterium]|nr:hypothetical protein [Holophagales bacterium]
MYPNQLRPGPTWWVATLLAMALALPIGPYFSSSAQDAEASDADESSADESISDTGTRAPTTAEPGSEPPSDGAADSPEDGEAPDAAEAPGGSKQVLYGRIDDDIDLAESAYLGRLLDEAESRKVDTVLIELNTFGGRVDAAVAMRDALLDTELETVIWINKRAISAGALISLACHRIAIAPGGTMGAATPVTSSPSQELPEPVQEKYLSYFRQEMRVTAEAHGRDGDIAEALVDSDVEVEGISEKGKLLTLNTRTALETGMADFEAADLDAVLAGIGAGADGLVRFERSWSEDLVGFLTSAGVASLLVFAMMIFAYLEIQTPGFGLFGGIALACFAILYFSHYLVNLAGHEELILVVIGLALLAVEIFVIPGTGIFAVLGATAVLAATVMVLMAGDWSDFTIENPFTLDAARQVAFTLVVSSSLSSSPPRVETERTGTT